MTSRPPFLSVPLFQAQFTSPTIWHIGGAAFQRCRISRRVFRLLDTVRAERCRSASSGPLAEGGRGRLREKACHFVPFCAVPIWAMAHLADKWHRNGTPDVPLVLSEAGHAGVPPRPGHGRVRGLKPSGGECLSQAQTSTDVLPGARARPGRNCSDSRRRTVTRVRRGRRSLPGAGPSPEKPFALSAPTLRRGVSKGPHDAVLGWVRHQHWRQGCVRPSIRAAEASALLFRFSDMKRSCPVVVFPYILPLG